MLTVDTMLELIRPLSEGLALFAEYDIVPGTSSISSTPLAWISIAMSARSEQMDLSQPQAAYELTDRLVNLRSAGTPSSEDEFSFVLFGGSRSVISRRIHNCKRLYLDLSQSVPALADTDLFLCYLRSYLFEDYGMVAIPGGRRRILIDKLQ